MHSLLEVSVAQASDKGVKAINQDCAGWHIPQDHLLQSKGVTVVLADGISSSSVSQEARKPGSQEASSIARAAEQQTAVSPLSATN